MKHTHHSLIKSDISEPQVVEVVEVRQPLHIAATKKTYKLAILDGWFFSTIGALMAAFALINYFKANTFTGIVDLFSRQPDLYVAAAALTLGIGLNRWARIMTWWES